MSWINVEDELPKADTTVLACVIQRKGDDWIWKGIISVYFNPQIGWITPFSGERIKVMYWQEAPELPHNFRMGQES